jgi:Uma2 family endonuclease
MELAQIAESPVFETTIEASKPPITRRRRSPLPLTFAERADMGEREVRVAATFQEYLDLSHDCEYRVHYRNGFIISFIEIDEKTDIIMGEATVTHERFVGRFCYFLSLILGFDGDFSVLGSNSKIFIGAERSGYNPDVMVVKGTPEIRKYKSNKRNSTGVVNPYLIVEILSKSTRNFDLSEKLVDYKLIPSLQQIIFVEQGSVWASTYIREKDNEWRKLDFTSLDEAIPVGDGSIALNKLYSKIFE